jgi:hypothetical protein
VNRLKHPGLQEMVLAWQEAPVTALEADELGITEALLEVEVAATLDASVEHDHLVLLRFGV